MLPSNHSHAVICTDLTGLITHWNHEAETLYGWLASEAIGVNVLSLIPTNESRDDAALIMSRLVRGESWSGEFHVRTRRGETLLVHVTDSPIRNDFGELVGVMGQSYAIKPARNPRLAGTSSRRSKA